MGGLADGACGVLRSQAEGKGAALGGGEAGGNGYGHAHRAGGGVAHIHFRPDAGGFRFQQIGAAGAGGFLHPCDEGGGGQYRQAAAAHPGGGIGFGDGFMQGDGFDSHGVRSFSVSAPIIKKAAGDVKRHLYRNLRRGRPAAAPKAARPLQGAGGLPCGP